MEADQEKQFLQHTPQNGERPPFYMKSPPNLTIFVFSNRGGGSGEADGAHAAAATPPQNGGLPADGVLRRVSGEAGPVLRLVQPRQDISTFFF